MQLLLDAHALLWWVTGDRSLSNRARVHVTQSEDVIASAISAWKMAIKVGLGRLPSALGLLNDFEDELAKDGFRALELTSGHGIRAGLLPELTKIRSTAC